MGPIIVFGVVFMIIFIVMTVVTIGEVINKPQSFFKCDYKDYYIEEKIDRNVCGEEVGRGYTLFYAVRYPFNKLKKKYVKFGWESTKEQMITRYKEKVISSQTTIIHEDICELKKIK